jgi:hypothetical protein
MIRRFLITAAMGFLFAFQAAAQETYPIVWAMAIDTISEKINPINKKIERAEKSDMGNKDNWQDMKRAPWEKMKAPQYNEWDEWRRGPSSQYWMFHPFRRFFLIPAIFGLTCLLVVFVVNILLTILVSFDMARKQQFNGLWIPVLLLAGIPGTCLYALFRIGDNIKAKE